MIINDDEIIEVVPDLDSPEEIARSFFHDKDIKLVENKIEDLKQTLLYMTHNNDRLQRQFNELWDKNWKDNELQEMKKQLEEMRANYHRGFPIDEADDKRINQWILKHDEEEHQNYDHYHGCSGGGYEYCFTPTGLGTINHCFCSYCKGKAIREKGKDWYNYCKNELHGVIKFGDFG